jgi:hypothetical protein
MRSRFRPNHATVVAYLALFIALGGTTYAATGGNFILGQPNSAGTPTQLSSPTTNSAGALKVTSTATSGGRAIQGTSAHGQGVYGHSGSNAGVVGDSGTFDGIFGVSNDTDSAGVSGHGDGGGYGLFGTGGNRLFNTAAIHGESAAGNAIEGFTTGSPASGVFGQDNNANSYGVAGHSNNGVAVVGDSSSGWAIQALGHATQSRTKGGFVKAMAFVDPFASTASEKIKQCFNSQRPIGTATSGDCGITYSSSLTGRYTLGFGFQVNDRFVSASAASDPGTKTVVSARPSPSSNTGVNVTTLNFGTNNYSTDRFFIFVY